MTWRPPSTSGAFVSYSRLHPKQYFLLPRVHPNRCCDRFLLLVLFLRISLCLVYLISSFSTEEGLSQNTHTLALPLLSTVSWTLVWCAHAHWVLAAKRKQNPSHPGDLLSGRQGMIISDEVQLLVCSPDPHAASV